MTLLFWADGIGKASFGDVTVDIQAKPELPFEFETLYYEPDAGMSVRTGLDGEQYALTDEEMADCEAQASYFVEPVYTKRIYTGLLSWSSGLGKAAFGDIMVDIQVKPELPFDFEALYFEPDTGMLIRIGLDGMQYLLTDEEMAACEAQARHLVEHADYTVAAYDGEGIFRGAMLRSEAEEQELLTTLRMPGHPASKMVDGQWQPVKAVIMDSGILKLDPESVCQLCLLVMTEAEWEAFPSRPATPFEVWDFATETWMDKRLLQEVKDEGRALIRRVFEGARRALLGAVPELEQSTWAVQEKEARAWLEDGAVPTPFIDLALQGQPRTKKELCEDILANAGSTWSLLGKIHAAQWQWYTAVNDCLENVQVDALLFALSETDWENADFSV